MDDSSGQRLASIVRSIDPGDFGEFVGVCCVELGWSVERLRDGAAHTDLQLTRQDDDGKRLARVFEDERELDEDCADLVTDVADEFDCLVLVTAGEVATDGQTSIDGTSVELMGIEALVDRIREAGLFDQVVEYAAVDSAGLEATFDGSESSTGQPVEHPSEDGVPAEFTEVMWRIGPGPVGRMDEEEKATHVEGVVEHAFAEAVTARSMLTPPGEAFSLPPADYLQMREQPAFVFEEPKRGISLENRGIAEEPAENGSTIHLITNQRVLTIVAQEDGEFTVTVPLAEVEDTRNDPGLFDGEVLLDLGDDVCHLPVQYGLGSDLVESASTYVERGPHPWQGAEITRASIDNPATFGEGSSGESR